MKLLAGTCMLFALLFLGTVQSLSAGMDHTELTIESIYSSYQFNEKGVWGIRPLNDGMHFSNVVYDTLTDLNNILQFKLESGHVTDTIFNGDWLRPVREEDPLDFDNYRLSRDENKILLATKTEFIYRHSTREFNYVYDRTKRTIATLSKAGKQRYATFSPDATKVAFVRDNNIFVKDLTTMQEYQVTHDGKVNQIINGATDWVYEEEFGFTRAFFWSPDSKKIAFYRFDERRVKEFSMPTYGGLYPDEYRFKYPKAGEQNSLVSIHVYHLESKRTVDMETRSHDDQYIPRIKWTHDPEKLSVLRMNRHQNHLELLLANVADGKTSLLLEEKNKAYLEITDDLTFLKDQKHFIWTSEKSGYNHIYLYDMQGKLVRQITNGDYDVTLFYGVDENKNSLYYQSAEVSPLERHIYSIQLDGKGKSQLSKEKGMHHAQFTDSFAFYIDQFSNHKTPTVVSVYNNEGGLVRVIEDNEELKERLTGLKLLGKEFFSFKTSDNVQLNGWMIKPTNFDEKKKYPVFMFVYGGPGSQTVKDAWGGNNYLWYEYLARQGYLVVSVDNRGTGGRGEAFKKVTYLKLGEYELKDQIEAAKHLASLDYVDRSRIGIFGWSYGGYMSSLCITRAAEIFKMAIAVAPVTHWKFYDTIYTERYMRTPQENESGYENGSPLNYAGSLEGKYLLIHGTADDNVHFQNSVEMVTSLTRANKHFDLFFYPDKNHSIRGGNARMHIYTKMTDFILENL